MTLSLLLTGSVILLSLLISKALRHTPLPSLLLFIALGMLFGENGLFHIPFDDYQAVDIICSSALVIIMFYGGFGTSLKAARPVLRASVLLSTVGVVLSALGLAALAHFILDLGVAESFLIGAVISSTDAASVFSILRGSRLSLKYHTDSLLEIESGSNDPMAFMLTAAAIALMTGSDLPAPSHGKTDDYRRRRRPLLRLWRSSPSFAQCLGWQRGPNPISPFRHAFILRRSYHTWRQWLSGDLSLRDSSRKRAHATKAESGALF